MRTKIQYLKHPKTIERLGDIFTIKGWVRTLRDQKTFSFIELNDGSTLSNFQVIVDNTVPEYSRLMEQISTGASIGVTGTLEKSPGDKQALELRAQSIELIGTCDPETYPLQKKRHSFDFLRTIAHLRPRTNTIGAVARVRNALAFATHAFFQERGFLYVHTPIITASDCEGGGQMFQVTTLPLEKLPKTKENHVDYSQDFFGKPAFLTVSGQLNGETYACGLSDIYTFGPTFRAENSNTSRHLAEFWMIEPEMAFCNLKGNMEVAEAYIKYVIRWLFKHAEEDLQFFNERVEPGLIARLEQVVNEPFEHVTYTYAIRILEKAGKTFEYPVSWGMDLQSEHERYLAEEYFKKPVIITDYPRKLKAFYMRDNDDGKTVSAMDVIVPKIGELIGGSQREERLPLLEAKLEEFGLHKEDYWWYLELRKYGSVPHSGFGVGFERLIQFATGMENIRDVIPFPRFPGRADF